MSDTSTPSIGNSTTTEQDDPLSQWNAGVSKQQDAIIHAQIETIMRRKKLLAIKGTEDPKKTIVTIVSAFPGGISFATIRGVCDPTADLTKARDELVSEHKVRVSENKRSIILFPVRAEEEKEESVIK